MKPLDGVHKMVFPIALAAVFAYFPTRFSRVTRRNNPKWTQRIMALNDGIIFHT